MMSNFDQMATAKECMQVLVSRAQKRVPCRKQISSGNTQERRFFWPAAPKPTRTSNVCLILRGLGRKRHY